MAKIFVTKKKKIMDAMKQLLERYEREKENLDGYVCPLCKAVSNDCSKCPWTTHRKADVKNYPCIYWREDNFPYLKTFTCPSPKLRQKRIRMLKNWISRSEVIR